MPDIYEPDQPVYCQTCGIEIGIERRYPTGTVIIMGGAELDTAHGRCRNPTCRAKWHYVAGDTLPPFLAKRGSCQS